MLKIRVIPLLTYNGFALVKTKGFKNPRMLGNPVQAARIFNARGVDELIFIDIFATKQKRKINLKIVSDVIKECFMPVGIGGGIASLQDINDLLKIGADKIILKSVALSNPNFIKEASDFFGSQCISIAVDVKRIGNEYLIHSDEHEKMIMEDFIHKMQDLGAGEIILNDVDNDGMMNGFDIELFNSAIKHTKIPLVAVGGGGNPDHFCELFSKTECNAVGASSIFNFTQFTPLDVKNSISTVNNNVRFSK